MPMKNPSHPGTVVLSECIEPLGLTITQAAQALGVTRTTLSELVNGKRGISPETSIRLSRVFGGSPKAGSHSRLTTTLRRFLLGAFSSSGWPWRDDHRVSPKFENPNLRHAAYAEGDYDGRKYEMGYWSSRYIILGCRAVVISMAHFAPVKING